MFSSSVLSADTNTLVVGYALFIIISFIFFLKRPQLVQIAYLDQKLWSLSFHSEQTISRVEILKIIDYQIFIVVYFKGDKH